MEGSNPANLADSESIRLGRQRNNNHIGCTGSLRLATWNCCGLSVTQKQLCLEMDYDILGLTETHDKGALAGSSNFIPAEPAPDDDCASGVALLLSQRMAKIVMHQGCVGSRIVFARFQAAVSNIFVICVYIPHANSTNPSSADTLSDLDNLLCKVPQSDCIIVLGDFNSRLPRLHKGLTGRWSVHTRADKHGGGVALLELMATHGLVAASTRHKPKRNHTNATFIQRDTSYKPVQLDYILCSERWVTSAIRSRVRWGPAIQRWGRKFDHGLVECMWKVRLKASKKIHKPDFSALKKDSEIARKFDADIRDRLSTEIDVANPCERLKRLNAATKEAISALPNRKTQPFRKRYVSDQTRALIESRAQRFQQLQPEKQERRKLNREISRSCRNDYRTYIRGVVSDIAKAADTGNMREVSRLTKSISSDKKPSSIMPSKASDGTAFTTTEQLLDSWKEFLGKKFACIDQPGAVYNPGIDEHLPGEDTISREEFDECVKALRCGKAAGWDGTPIEAYLFSENAMSELYELVCLIWRTEVVPDDLVHALFIMLYKKGCRDDFSNYRAIGLLCHSYKVLSVLILRRMQPALEERLPDSQAGFRKARGCRDNVLILKIIIDEIVKAEQEAVITFIDYTAAFDSVSHRFLDESLAEAMVPPKVRRMIRAIYSCATGAVRIQRAAGEQLCSERFDIRRGSIQGDIYSPPSFTLALDRIFRRHDIKCDGVGGPPLKCPRVSKLEYADDAALLNANVNDASERLTSLANGGSRDACLELSLKKTKVMPVRRYERVSTSTEEEITALKFKHTCAKCDRTFPTERGLKIHISRWCRPGRPLRSRKGSLADKAVKKSKRIEQATQMPRVCINGHQLDNVLGFDYLGCRLCGDGDDSADMYQRMNIATARFFSLNNIWKDTRLPRSVKLDLYRKSVCTVFAHGSEAWKLTPPIRRAVNGFNSRCLHRITGRSYRMEATNPTFHLVRALEQRRMRWLGHILRMPEERLLRRTVLEAAGDGPPYPTGSLMTDINVGINEIKTMAEDRDTWSAFVDERSL